MQLVDHTGQLVSLGRELGQGGEGIVFEVDGCANLVAKVYKNRVDIVKAHKLLCMAKMASPDLTRLAAWPTAVLSKRTGGDVCGIAMPRLMDAKEIHVLYSPAQRRMQFQHADWHFLVRAARNCAATFATLHQAGIVVGDVNQGNILVDRQALVRLIDCDSFQLNVHGRIFRCTVGVPHFTPPELQTTKFDQVDRTQNHDSFGLAVIIFHLLFMGRHPFVGRFFGHGEMPTIEKSISEYRFAFGADAGRFFVAPPPHSPTLSIVPRELAELFERSFGKGSENLSARPRASEWVGVLDRLESSIRKCPTDPGHLYSAAASSCPWCALAGNGGPNFFISVTVQRIQAAPKIDVAQILFRISCIPKPGQKIARATRLPTSTIQPLAPPPLAADRELMTNALAVTAAATFVTSLALLPTGLIMLAIVLCVLSAVLAGVWLPLYAGSPLRQVRAERRNALRKAQREHSRVADAMAERIRSYTEAYNQKLAVLQRARNELEYLDQQRANELAQLQQHANERQFTEYMEQFNIADARIQGIGANRAEVLAYLGIETAWDVPDAATIMSVPGFGKILADRLLAWKEGIARQFQFNAAQGLPTASVQMLTVKYQQRRVQLELTIQNGETELQKIWLASKEELESLDRRAATLEFAVEQARADLNAV